MDLLAAGAKTIAPPEGTGTPWSVAPWSASNRLAGSLGTTALLVAIRLYRRFVSPHKGFRCAYAAYTGRASCSTLGYRVVRRHGAGKGLALLRARLARCGVAHRRHVALRDPSMRTQRGFCDACDAFDGLFELLDVASCACDVASCWPGTTQGDRAQPPVRRRATATPGYGPPPGT